MYYTDFGINTKLKSDSLWMHGLVCSLDKQRMIEYQEAIQFKDAKSREEKEDLAEELGVIMATKIFHHGADKILKELAHRTPL